MKTKYCILSSLAGAVLMGAGVVGTMYVTQWREPTAVYQETTDPELIKIRQNLEAYKAKLREEGKYFCCIKNDCNWCAVYMGHCPCGDLVMEKGVEKSCPDCAAAWNKKQGKIPGVDPNAIQVTTFGIYGFEEGGHHGSDPAKEPESEAHEKTEEHH